METQTMTEVEDSFVQLPGHLRFGWDSAPMNNTKDFFFLSLILSKGSNVQSGVSWRWYPSNTVSLRTS